MGGATRYYSSANRILIAEDDRDVKATVVETEDHIVLSCKYRSTVSLCRALSETDNRQYLLLDGHLSGRYSAYNTKYRFVSFRKPSHKTQTIAVARF